MATSPLNLMQRGIVALQLAPAIIVGIHTLETEADEVTKSKLAVDSLALAVGITDEVAPEFQPITDTIGTLISTSVEAITAVFHKTGTLPPVAAAPASPTPQSAAAPAIAIAVSEPAPAA